MSNKVIVPGRLSGTIEVPASKSDGQRALLCAALAKGVSVITGLGSSSDELSMLSIARSLGRTVEQNGSTVVVSGILELKQPLVLNAGESGLSSRLITGVAAGFGVNTTVTGSGSLLQRPMHFWLETLPKLGVSVNTNSGYLPVTVKGPYKQFEVEVDGSQSSQYISGLIMGLVFIGKIFRLRVKNLVSASYLEMTLKTLRDFGVEIQQNGELYYVARPQHFCARRYYVETDWSSAAFWLTAAALGHRVTVSGLNRNSLQADVSILDALHLAGCELRESGKGISFQSDGLKAFTFDATDCPDLFPILAVLATQCQGTTVLVGVSRLKDKESDRGKAILSELSKMGASLLVAENEMHISGPTKLTGAALDSHGDHRMVMSLAIAASIAESPSEIFGSEHVDKSYPAFWKDWKELSTGV